MPRPGHNSGRLAREKLKNARSTSRSMHAGAEGHVREVVEEPAHDFRMKGAIGKGSLLETVFHVREAGYEVEKRIVESRRPLQRCSTSTAADSYYQRAEDIIPIPVRAEWDPRASASEVQQAEDEAFEEYLQDIYNKYPPYRLNHFEHNLHVWRQLWRVVEISDILVLVADARHPLFHVPPALYDYIVHHCGKPMVCVLNKIDFISSANLRGWIDDFKVRFPLLTVVPFSSFPHEKTITNPDADTVQDKKRKAIQHEKNKAGGVKGLPPPYGVENLLRVLEEVYRKKQERDAADNAVAATAAGAKGVDPNWRPSRAKKSKAAFAKARASARENGAVDSEELMASIKQIEIGLDLEGDAKKQEQAQALRAQQAKQEGHAAGAAAPSAAAAPIEEGDAEEEDDDNADEAGNDDAATISAAVTAAALAASVGGTKSASKITIGTIGHPNVGKSSLINALFGRAVVTVSETPGKTKHLQTLALNDRMELCDCPGLVFAAVDMPRALQVLCGIFPISQLREPYTSVSYLAQRVRLEKIYGLTPPTAQSILEGKGIEVTSTSGAAKGKAKAKSKAKPRRGDDEEEDAFATRLDAEDAMEAGDTFSQLQLAEATAAAAAYEWSAWDICEAYARQRSYSIKGSKGLYDTQRAANDILHDALSGVVLLTFAPPHRQMPVAGDEPAASDAAAAAPDASASAPAAAAASVQT